MDHFALLHWRSPMLRIGVIAIAFLSAALPIPADDSIAEGVSRDFLQRSFTDRVAPLIETHCLACHDTETQEAKLNLSEYRDLSGVIAAYPVWDTVMERVAAGEMPPEDSDTPLGDEDRRRIVDWIGRVRSFEANRNAGDPGPVLARRLSNAEYDYSIRDLTGVDMRPTKTFPVDPANEAGFDNSGESLSMSPALLNKYLQAARYVAEHLVLTPTQIRFAPHPVMTDTDRDKYCVKRIVEFYQRQPTDYADYFFVAWQYRHREQLGRPQATLADLAAESGLSGKYLAMVWEALGDKSVKLGPLVTLQNLWENLPSETSDDVHEQCQQMRDFVVRTRKWFEPSLENLYTNGVHNGSQPFVL